MEQKPKSGFSDEDEDLEALRMAALQTIKKKEAQKNGRLPELFIHSPGRFGRSKGGHKRGRFYGPLSGRGPKSNKQGQFNNYNGRVRNSNLISITTVPSEGDTKTVDKQISSPPLILPQDRYCGKTEEEKRTENTTSKFNRYDNSDKSESESEEEIEESEDDSPGKLEKADSLEALMQELDDEIQGISKPKDDKPVPKKRVKKKKKHKISESANETSETEQKETIESIPECIENKDVVEEDKPPEDVEETKPEVETSSKPDDEGIAKENQKPESQISPKQRNTGTPPRFRHPNNHNRRNRRGPPPVMPFAQQNIPPFIQQQPPYIPLVQAPPFVQQFNPAFGPPPQVPPPFYERPLSPLAINTEQLTTATMAPLSPRSARFVLQNRAIIEKRKRSPRRSYSRSPSPRFRRSKSPRRSSSPLNRRKSLSPRRRSLSPRRTSPNKRLPAKKEEAVKSKAPVRDRLGTKGDNTGTKTDEIIVEMCPKKDDDKPLDPVLEARRRKFEKKEINIRGGIIRLKPKDEPGTDSNKSPEKSDEKDEEEPCEKNEETQVKEEVKSSPKKVEKPNYVDELDGIDEDALLADDEIDLLGKEDIFSDEESASDNEGRFKDKENSNQKVAVLPFTKLVNGDREPVREKPLIEERRSGGRSQRRSRNRSRSPIKTKSRERISSRKDDNAKIDSREDGDGKRARGTGSQVRKRVVKAEKKHISPQLEKRFERRIEIKIKNPAKYEKNKEEMIEFGPKPKRKVEIQSKINIDVTQEEDESDVVVENEAGDEEEMNSSNEAGDLRAQLSKKRAERMHKGGAVEGNAGRLLQNALEGVVGKMLKKQSKTEKDLIPDGKLPIHLRLGVAGTDAKPSPRKKSKKSRGNGQQRTVDQVYYYIFIAIGKIIVNYLLYISLRVLFLIGHIRCVNGAICGELAVGWSSVWL